MTKEELMALAQEAGVVPVNRAHLHLEPVWWSVTAEDLERFAALITGHEREECAKLCDRHAAEPLILRAMTLNERPFSGAALDCAELIRMRSNALGQEPCAAVCARSPAPMGSAALVEQGEKQ